MATLIKIIIILFGLVHFHTAEAQAIATFTYPAQGETNVRGLSPFQWTIVPQSQAYYLYIGTKEGDKDIYDSGEINSTSIAISTLPSNTKLYGRIWTKAAGIWRFSSISFTTGDVTPAPAVLVFPKDYSTGYNGTRAIEWSPVQDAQAYYLYLGSAPGTKDLYDSGELQQAFSIPVLPSNRQVYVTLWTKRYGIWTFRSSYFMTENVASRLVYPKDGAVAVTGAPFTWIKQADAVAYYLYIGSTKGAKDIFDSGERIENSITIPTPPSYSTLFVTLWTKYGNEWLATESTFQSGENQPQISQLIYPDTQGIVGPTSLFQWEEIKGAQVYYLYIGSSRGAKDIFDSGEITKRDWIITNMPTGRVLYARLWTKRESTWYYTDRDFTTSAIPSSNRLASVLEQTALIRSMADSQHYPFSGTLLATVTERNGRKQATCYDYAEALLRRIREFNLGLARVRDTIFAANDSHTLIEYFNEEQGSWMIVDPTFALAAKNTQNNRWISVEELSSSTIERNWSRVTFVPLSSSTVEYATAYFLDYPLLFLNPIAAGANADFGTGRSPLPFLEEMTIPFSGALGSYLLRGSGDSATVIIDAQPRVLKLYGTEGFSPVFLGYSVADPSSAGFRVYKPIRVVFKR